MASEATQQALCVMVAVDYSKQAEDAFDFYCNTLYVPGHRVVLVHVPEGPTVRTSEGMHLPDGEWQKMRDHEKKETAEMVKKYAAMVEQRKIKNSEYKTIYGGKPGEALIQAAKEVKASMIVMGTRGMGTVRRTIMGSVSNYVLHHASVPVIICRAPK